MTIVQIAVTALFVVGALFVGFTFHPRSKSSRREQFAYACLYIVFAVLFAQIVTTGWSHR